MPFSAFDQAPPYCLPNTRTLAVRSRAGADYVVSVAWPAGEPPAEGWPTAWLLGGDAFAMTAEVMRYRTGGGTADSLTPGVLVAVGYPGATRRGFDYTPSSPPKAPPGVQGGGPAFLSFLLDELRPSLAAQLPLDPARHSVIGHSLGGLFALYTLFTQPLAFSQYVAASASVWWNDGWLAQAAENYVPALDGAPARRVFMSAAEYEQAMSPHELVQNPPDLEIQRSQRQNRAMVDRNRALAERLSQIPGLDVHFHYFPGETHRTVVPPSMLAGACFVFDPAPR